MTWDESLESSGARVFSGSFVARFDGKGFSQLTGRKEYCRPYDAGIASAMEAAVERVISVLSPDFVYSISDEISAFFFARPGGQLPFGGKENKIVSIGAAAAAVAFSIKAGTEADFDGRAFHCHDNMVKEYLISRIRSGFKNSVSRLAQCHFSAKSLHGVNTAEKIAALSKAGITYDDMPSDFKYGKYWFREPVEVWSEVAGANIVRNRWCQLSPKYAIDDAAIAALEGTIGRLTSQGAAAPKPVPPDPTERSVEASGQGSR